MREIQKLIVAKETNNLGFSMDDLLNYKKDFIKICQQSFEMLGSIFLTSYGISELLNGHLDTLTFLSTAAGTYGDSRTIPAFVKDFPISINEIHEKHLARKYLTKITSIS